MNQQKNSDIVSNDKAEPRRSVLRQNIEKTQSQPAILPLALAPLLDQSSYPKHQLVKQGTHLLTQFDEYGGIMSLVKGRDVSKVLDEHVQASNFLRLQKKNKTILDVRMEQKIINHFG